MFDNTNLATDLRKRFLPRVLIERPSVFLVGAQSKKSNTLRNKIRDELARRPRARKSDVYYPEDLLDDLLSGKMGRKYDLLELEGLLAASVDAVIILLEGPGAIAELGAFANHQELSKKLIVVVDRRYRRRKSFIMLGPVRRLAQQDKASIVYFDFDSGEYTRLGTELRKRIYNKYRGRSISRQPDNPIPASKFLLGCLLVRQPLSVVESADLIKRATTINQDLATLVARMALGILESRRHVYQVHRRYFISRQGIKEIKERIQLTRRPGNTSRVLDSHRIEYLTDVLRQRKLTSV